MSHMPLLLLAMANSNGWLPYVLFIGAILLVLIFLRFFLHLLAGFFRIGCLLLIGLGLLWFYLTYLR
jgi:hypothetical protein